MKIGCAMHDCKFFFSLVFQQFSEKSRIIWINTFCCHRCFGGICCRAGGHSSLIIFVNKIFILIYLTLRCWRLLRFFFLFVFPFLFRALYTTRTLNLFTSSYVCSDFYSNICSSMCLFQINIHMLDFYIFVTFLFSHFFSISFSPEKKKHTSISLLSFYFPLITLFSTL